jgi:ATP-dependent exoDNAse (exonuclease V) beta subunit
LQEKPVHITPYVIYNASAGSGKTFTLVKEYLKILLAGGNNHNYRKILAITFTNKAVNEMKERILNSLYEFANPKTSLENSALFLQLSQELQLDEVEIRQKAKKTLKEILHNYAFFDISTIDKFNHRLLRTFAKDLKLPQNFEVILDTDLLLDEAVERLIAHAGTKPHLTKILVDFALEKIDDYKSWNIAIDLNKVGKMLFNENHSNFIKELSAKEIDTFLDLQKYISKTIVHLERHMKVQAENILQVLEMNNLSVSDFKSGYFPKFMLKVIEHPGSIDFTASWKQKFGEEPLYNKTCKDETKSIIDSLMPQFLSRFIDIKESFYKHSFFKNIYGNIVPLTVLNALQNEIDLLMAERDQLPISSFNTLISNEIKNQPAPFIYERLGEKYRHYFIDEFQDTSLLQWNNLVPLIDNALQSEDLQGNRGSLFLVGDAKQAIYRWRGGRSEQFLNLITNVENPFNSIPETKNLETNFRSYQEIVTFNNDFFTLTSPFLNSAIYNELFVQGNQQDHTAKPGGLVRINFIADQDQDKDLAYCEEVVASIKEAESKNFTYGDMCILVRKKKHGVLLAEYLTTHKIPIISSETLLLNNNEAIRFLLNLLYYIHYPTDLNISYEILYYLCSSADARHHLIQEYLPQLDTYLEKEYHFDFSHFKSLSIYDGFEYAIKQFDLITNSNAYITYFMDEVLDVELHKDAGLSTFMTYWEKKKGSLSIPAPENANAVQLMTIHKAKGLEFPIVIFPYANTYIYEERDPKLWVPVPEDLLKGFTDVLVNKKKEMVHYNDSAAALYNEEQHKMELDAFNLLYVVLTRAINGLFIISEKDLTTKGEHKPNYYSGLFIHYLKEKHLWDEDRMSYDFGNLDKAPNNKEAMAVQEVIPYIYTTKNNPKLQISTQLGELWGTRREASLTQGNLIHYAMSLISYACDMVPAIETLVLHGYISVSEKPVYHNKIQKIVAHPELIPFYADGIEVKNEHTIISKNGVILRPDRLSFKGKDVNIIDYKTGKATSAHKIQLMAYADALRAMGFTIENKIIVYINEHITPEFI